MRNDKDLGGPSPTEGVSAGSIASDAASHAAPTVAEMRANYDKFSAAVDKEAIMLATIYAAVCADHIERLLKVLESGDYALVSLKAASEPLETLRRIARWHGEFPDSGMKWGDGSVMSYSAAFGSNGERDFMRQLALAAIAKAEGK